MEKMIEYLKNIVKNNHASGGDFNEGKRFVYYDFMNGNRINKHFTIVYSKNEIIGFHIIIFGKTMEEYNENNYKQFCEKYL